MNYIVICVSEGEIGNQRVQVQFQIAPTLESLKGQSAKGAETEVFSQSLTGSVYKLHQYQRANRGRAYK